MAEQTREVRIPKRNGCLRIREVNAIRNRLAGDLRSLKAVGKSWLEARCSAEKHGICLSRALYILRIASGAGTARTPWGGGDAREVGSQVLGRQHLRRVATGEVCVSRHTLGHRDRVQKVERTFGESKETDLRRYCEKSEKL